MQAIISRFQRPFVETLGEQQRATEQTVALSPFGIVLTQIRKRLIASRSDASLSVRSWSRSRSVTASSAWIRLNLPKHFLQNAVLRGQ
jgi:hypothetical protein